MALLLFAAIGRFSHGFRVFDIETLHTADPFIAGLSLSISPYKLFFINVHRYLIATSFFGTFSSSSNFQLLGARSSELFGPAFPSSNQIRIICPSLKLSDDTDISNFYIIIFGFWIINFFAFHQVKD